MAVAGRELIGRAAELAAADEVLEGGPGAPRALLLSGEAGIGKTSLWRAALAAARDRRRILRSAPAEAEASLPYSVLGDLLDRVGDAELGALPAPLGAALEIALFRSPGVEDSTDRLAVSAAFLRLLRELAAESPVLLAVDDLQWCDAPSLRVLAYALQRLDDNRAALVATLRPPAPPGLEAALRKAAGDGGLRSLEVGPLPRDAIDDLLLQRLERPLRRPALEQVYRVSGGNPFFALEIGRFLVQHPAGFRSGEPQPLPASLSEAIEARLANLSDAAQDVLLAMAALSRPDDRLLLGLSPGAAAGLDEAANARVVERAGGRLRFTHPLLASAVYSRAEPAARRALHERLAGLVADPEDKARHLALSALHADEPVAGALEKAAVSANARGAPDAAAGLARQAEELTPPGLTADARRRRILAAEYLMRAGDVPSARSLLEDLIGSSPPAERPVEALRLMGTLTLGGEDLGAAERYLTEALELAAGDQRAQARVLRELTRAYIQQGKHEAAYESALRFRAVAESCGEEALAAVARSLIGATANRLHQDPAEAREIAVALAEERLSIPMDDGAGGLHPLMEWAVLLKFGDDFRHARMLFKRVLTLTEGRDESTRAPVLFHLAELECWTGDSVLAALYAQECEKCVVQTGHDGYRRLSLSARATLLLCRGELEAARAAAEEAAAVSAAVRDEPYLRRALATLGSAELAAGNPAAADVVFEKMRARGDQDRYLGIVRCEADEAEALLALDRAAEAETVLARLERSRDPWPRAAAARVRALLAGARGDLEGSLAEFEGALAAHAALEMPLERARTLLAKGVALRRAKRKRQAREALEEALAAFERLGASAWRRRALTELERIAPAPAGLGTLTPTEERVAGLVAAGRTNKEVAAELFMSVKTVEANLSRVYAKLAVRSRTELAARLRTG